MIKLEEVFNKYYNKILEAENSSATFKQNYTEAGKNINLNQCRKITTDVLDNRGELETNYCIDYPVAPNQTILTRVQARLILIKHTENEVQFLGKKTRFSIMLPGGGYDGTKDNGNIINTATRELFEESNMNIKNARYSGVSYWKYRVDPWVEEHVENSEDYWSGYYTMIVTGEYAGESNNENPEELGKWKWLPIDLLNKGNKFVKKALNTINISEEYNMDLDEVWGNEHGEQDKMESGKLSYLTSDLVTLETILTTNKLKASKKPEIHETDRINSNKRSKAAYYKYISFSEQLYSHAWRKPGKWGFGIVVDENKIVNKFSLDRREHEYRKLAITHLYKCIDNSGIKRYILRVAGSNDFVEITEEFYSSLKTDMFNYGEKQQNNPSLNPYYTRAVYKGNKKVAGKELSASKVQAWTTLVITNQEDLIRYKNSLSEANIDIKNCEIIEVVKYFGSSNWPMLFYLPRKYITNADNLVNYLISETYYNEGEKRIWIKDIDPYSAEDYFIELPNNTITGIILPAQIADAIQNEEESSSQEILTQIEKQGGNQLEALEHIWQIKDEYNLKLYVHHASDMYHYRNLNKDRSIKTQSRNARK